MPTLCAVTSSDEDDINACLAQLAARLCTARDFLFFDAGRTFEEITRALELAAQAVDASSRRTPHGRAAS
jgi:DeoR/GlpR family transcriptional regulator of sugar metabolism